jgi:hypothetical protein
VGANRRGPLAAFVVIAIIAAILLVTSVRSQAAPGWLDPDRIPATAVASPSAAAPHLWDSRTAGEHDARRGGVAPPTGAIIRQHAGIRTKGSARIQRAWLLRLGWWTQDS